MSACPRLRLLRLCSRLFASVAVSVLASVLRLLASVRVCSRQFPFAPMRFLCMWKESCVKDTLESESTKVKVPIPQVQEAKLDVCPVTEA